MPQEFLADYLRRIISAKLKCKKNDDPKIIRLTVDIDLAESERYIATCDKESFLKTANKIKLPYLRKKYGEMYAPDAYFEELLKRTKSEEISALFSEKDLDAD